MVLRDRPDSIELEARLESLDLPQGLALAKGTNERFPSIESSIEYWRNLPQLFASSIIDEQRQLESEFNDIVPLSGSLLIHYFYLLQISKDFEIQRKHRTIYALEIKRALDENGQGAKQEHIYSRSEISILPTTIKDDIHDSGGCVRRITTDMQVLGISSITPRIMTTKETNIGLMTPGTNQPPHVYSGYEWIAGTAGMDLGIGDTKHTKTNPLLVAQKYEISQLERTCGIALASIDDEAIASWNEPEIEAYKSLLRSVSIFPDGIPNHLKRMYDVVDQFKQGFINESTLWATLHSIENEILGVEI